MSSKADRMRVETGQRLKRLRQSLEIRTIRAFAGEIGVSEDRYDKWEKGEVLIPQLWADVLVDRYGITMDWLYAGRGSGLPQRLYEKLRDAG